MIYKEKMFFWLVAGALFIMFISAVSEVLLPFVVGILVAYFLDPVADKLEEKDVSRTLSSVAIIFAFSFFLVMLLIAVIPILYNQLFDLINNIPTYVNGLKDQHADVYAKIQSLVQLGVDDQVKDKALGLSGMALKISQNFVGQVIDSSFAVINVLSLIFISPVVAFYMLRDYDIMVAKIDSWLPRKNRDTIREQLSIIDQTLSGFVRGAVNVCIILGIFYGVALSVAGLQYGLLIGFMTGILSFIPYVGMLIGMSTGLVVAYFQFDGEMAQIMVILAIFLVGQVLEGNFLTPKMVGDKVGLHAVWIIFGLLSGGVLLGFTGVLIAIPVTAVIGVLARFFLGQYLASRYFNGDEPPIKIITHDDVEKE